VYAQKFVYQNVHKRAYPNPKRIIFQEEVLVNFLIQFHEKSLHSLLRDSPSIAKFHLLQTLISYTATKGRREASGEA